MNPTLFEWLDRYQSAAAEYAEETRYLHVDQIPPARPLAMQFTITTTGLLRDHAGARMGHVTEMNTAALRAIGVDRTRLTARQRRTPMPRRNPDTTRQPNFPTDAELAATLNASNPWTPPEGLDLTGIPDGAIQPLTTAYAGATTLPNPGELTLTRTWPEDAIPEDAAPGDVVTDGDNRRVGIVGRNGRNEVIVLRDPNPLHDRLRRGHTVPIPDLSRVSEGFRTAAASMAAAFTPAPEEVHVGPRMLADIGQEQGSAARYMEHTVTVEAAHLRAGATYHTRPQFRAMVRRSADEAPTFMTVDRNAAAVSTFLTRAYGIELNEEALSAVTAMATTMIRQGAIVALNRATGAERAAQQIREHRDALLNERDTLRNAAAPVISTVDPGPVEAAVAAAKAWKETGIEDSVAKLNSFKHLLDTLDQLAR